MFMQEPVVTQTAKVARRDTRKRTVSWRRVQEITTGYALLAPAIVLLIVFEIFPIGYGLYISMCNWRLGCTRFVGVLYYTRALHDRAMWHALWITAVYALLTVPLQLGLGLGIAWLLYQR